MRFFTFSKALENWQKYAKGRLSERSFQIYLKRLKQLLEELGDKPVKEITKQDIALAIGSISSPSVREQVIASYKSLRDFLIDFYDIELPSVPSFIRPKSGKNLPKPITEDVIFKMLQIAEEKAGKGYPWKLAAVVLMAFAGLRASEVLYVKSENLYKDSDGNIWLRIRGKGNKERVIPLPENEYTTWLWENRKVVLPIKVHYQTLYKTIKKLGKKSGDKNATPHRLRHFYGTYLSRKGVPVQVIQELMGHSSPATTMGYVKVSNREKVETIKKVFG